MNTIHLEKEKEKLFINILDIFDLKYQKQIQKQINKLCTLYYDTGYINGKNDGINENTVINK